MSILILVTIVLCGLTIAERCACPRKIKMWKSPEEDKMSELSKQFLCHPDDTVLSKMAKGEL